MASLSCRPPLKSTISRENTIPTAISRQETAAVSIKAVINARLAPSWSPRPTRMATTVAPPMGNMAARATVNVIKGTATFTAPRAWAPTPWPTKMPSTTL